MKYRALLLDFDNTLVGTEKAHYTLFTEMFRELVGRPFEREDLKVFNGTWKSIFAKMTEIYLPSMTPEEIRAVFTGSKADYFRKHPVSVAKDIERIYALDIKKAIVTGSSREEVSIFASSVELGRFDIIVTDDMYANGKPAPDAFLYAADRLGFAPQECLSVEDSSIGLRSARAAGTVTVFTSEFADEDHSGMADYTVGCIGEVTDLLQ